MATAHRPARSFFLRLQLAPGSAFGPGKAGVLEAVRDHGSITAAARALGMSYRRVWQLVDRMNTSFRGPLVETLAGGRGGGGARLTALGVEVLQRYRCAEAACARAIAAEHRALRRRLAP